MAAMMPVAEPNNHSDSPNYKQKYRILKRKLKFLLYEQEYFQDELHRVQKKLLRVSRDKSFLLDRLLQYENIENSSSDEERTASSSGASDNEGLIKGFMEELPQPAPRAKKAKLASHGIASEHHGMYPSSEGGTSGTGAEVEMKNMVQCKYSSNDSQCQELISKRSKSGYCSAHRTIIRISKQAISGSKKQKSQFGDSRNDQSIVDEQQLQHLRELPESHTSNEVPHATELPQDVFNIEEDEKDSENEDSTGSPGFSGGNIYEGDDDLVIDLQE